jgi:hypothetical protein
MLLVCVIHTFQVGLWVAWVSEVGNILPPY